MAGKIRKLALLLCFPLNGKLYSYIEQFFSPTYMVPREGFNKELEGGTSALSILPPIQRAKENSLGFWLTYFMQVPYWHFPAWQEKNRSPSCFRLGLIGFAVRWLEDPQRKVVKASICYSNHWFWERMKHNCISLGPVKKLKPHNN